MNTLKFSGLWKQPLVPHATLPAYLSRDVLTLAPYLSPPLLIIVSLCLCLVVNYTESLEMLFLKYLNVRHSSSLKVRAQSLLLVDLSYNWVFKMERMTLFSELHLHITVCRNPLWIGILYMLLLGNTRLYSTSPFLVLEVLLCRIFFLLSSHPIFFLFSHFFFGLPFMKVLPVFQLFSLT